MKAAYPNYRNRESTAEIYNSLSQEQKKIIDDYTAYLGTTAGKNKVLDYRRYMLQVGDIIEKDFDKFTPQDIINFVALLNQDSTREVNTKNCIKVTLKRFIKYYYPKDLDMLNEKILKKLNQKYVLVNEKKINEGTLLKPEELEILLRIAENLRLKCQIITLYESGCRPCELRLAKWKNVDWDRKVLNVFSPKTKKSRPLPLNESMIHLKRWFQEFQYPHAQEDDFIFPSPKDRKKPIGSFEFSYWIRSLGKKAKLNRPLYPYLIRHSRLTELHNKFKIQGLEHKKFAGHSAQSDMTAVYVRLSNEDMVNSVISKVYHVEDLQPEESNSLKKEVKEMKLALANVSRILNQIGIENNNVVIPMDKWLKMNNKKQHAAFDISKTQKHNKLMFVEKK